MKLRAPNKIFFAGVLGFFLLASPLWAEKVRVVIDGDTFVLEDNQRVRMVGIDAPEIDHPKYGKKGEPFGREATEHLKSWIHKKDVVLKKGGKDEFDRFGRRLAYVYLQDGTFVNREMIQGGYAEVYRRFPFEFKEEFSELEKQAKKTRKGMWGKQSVKSENSFLKLLGLTD